MRGVFWLGLALLGFAGGAAAQQARADRIELLQFGLYKAERTSDTAAPGTPAGQVHTITSVTFTDATPRIPARLGTRFGIQFRVVGTPADQNVTLREIWRLPAPGLRNPTSGNIYRESVVEFTMPLGATRVRGYGFDHDWEVVPGDWTIEIWDGQRRLLAYTFNVYRP